MRIEIEIPKEFEEHFKQDKFEDSLHRLSADAHFLAGNYDQETAIMLIKAFAESKPAYDIDKIVERLEEEKGDPYDYTLPEDRRLVRHWNNCIDVCKDIVEAGGADE